MSICFVDKHILIGAAEGIYSLNITDQVHDIEMEQVCLLQYMYMLLSW